ncbi:primase-helicase zinc-binding domain-containing protein [Desulfovibrio sp. ZJ200]|uniref:primase-helicase zinc-binding domain-containing protein n=1 Tax=Desulfovibrio sp. ZJ200 TaxID=2709792 RepID=UPI0013ECE353|nr:primase-helicase zinc-binding domain-containing protein [Desulfovibrio sp. ZJ200]
MSDLLLSWLRQKVEPSKIKKASGSKGGEYHSPCPMCGGEDRFAVFPEQPGGALCQKHGLTGTWSCPRHCEKGGDALTWLMEIDGLSFKAACAKLGIAADAKDRPRGYRPVRVPHRAEKNVFTPGRYEPPAAMWREHATKLALEAYERLLQTPPMLRYLARRGLPVTAVRAYRLGYIEAEGHQRDCIYRARAAFGLPEKLGAEGKPVRALRIPRGITIPVWSSAGECLRVRIRRRDVDRNPNNPKDPKYLLVPQPGQPYSAPLMLPPAGVSPDLATWVVVEAEMDAMAVHHACGGKVGVLSILTVRFKPDALAHAALARAARILVALDFDADKADGSNPGADAWPWWQRTYPQARLWPVPDGKDPGEAFALGINLAEWIFTGVPLLAADPATSMAGQALDRSEIAVSLPAGAVGESRVAPSASGERGRCWPVPDVSSLEAVALPREMHTSVDELVRAMRAHPLDDPECLLPCPFTDPPFWWKYRRDCKKCAGHPLCLLGLLQSPVFEEALHASV